MINPTAKMEYLKVTRPGSLLKSISLSKPINGTRKNLVSGGRHGCSLRFLCSGNVCFTINRVDIAAIRTEQRACEEKEVRYYRKY